LTALVDALSDDDIAHAAVEVETLGWRAAVHRLSMTPDTIELQRSNRVSSQDRVLSSES